MFIPHLGGRVCPSQPRLRGAWIGLDWSHTLGHLFRAALERVALEYGIYLQILKSLYPDLKISEIRITGGGEKSHIWNQIKADVLGDIGCSNRGVGRSSQGAGPFGGTCRRNL